jgi:hypothetical protein
VSGRQNVAGASGFVGVSDTDFVMPGGDDRLMIDVVDEGHQALSEFVF